MFKHLKALLWGRKEIIAANRTFAVNLLMPVLFVVLFRFLYKDMGSPSDVQLMVLKMTIPIYPAFLANVIALVIAEEQEKHNLISLQLSGIGLMEYIVANLFIPVIVGFIYMFGIPLYLGESLSDLSPDYFLVNLLTIIVVSLLFLIVGLLSDTQTKASLLSIPTLLISVYLPMFSTLDKTIGKIADYSYMSAMTKLSQDLTKTRVLDKSLLISFVWLVALIFLALLISKKRRVIN